MITSEQGRNLLAEEVEALTARQARHSQRQPARGGTCSRWKLKKCSANASTRDLDIHTRTVLIAFLLVDGSSLIVCLLSLLGRDNGNPEDLEEEKEHVNASGQDGGIVWRKGRRGDGAVSARNFG